MTSSRESFDLKLDNLQIKIIAEFTLEVTKELNQLLLDKDFVKEIKANQALKIKYANLQSQVVYLLAYSRIEESRRIFISIPESELLSLNLDNEKYKKPFYQQSVRDFDLSCFTIMLNILSSKDLPEVLLAIEMWVKVLDICMTEKDFHGTHLILAAINSHAISRLTRITNQCIPAKEFELLSTSAKKILESAMALSHDNYKLIKENNENSIPYLPMYQLWLNALHEIDQLADKEESSITKEDDFEDDNTMSRTFTSGTFEVTEEFSIEESDGTESILSTRSFSTSLNQLASSQVLDPLIQLREQHKSKSPLSSTLWNKLTNLPTNIAANEEDKPQLVRKESAVRIMLDGLSYLFKPRGNKLKIAKDEMKINLLLEAHIAKFTSEYWLTYFEKHSNNNVKCQRMLQDIKEQKSQLIQLLASNEALAHKREKIKAIQSKLNTLYAELQQHLNSAKANFKSIFGLHKNNSSEEDKRSSWGPTIFRTGSYEGQKNASSPVKTSPLSRFRAGSAKTPRPIQSFNNSYETAQTAPRKHRPRAT